MLVLNIIADVKRLCNSAACKHPADYLSVLSPCPYIASKTDMLCNIFGKFIYFGIGFGVICQGCITICLCICYAISMPSSSHTGSAIYGDAPITATYLPLLFATAHVSTGKSVDWFLWLKYTTPFAFFGTITDTSTSRVVLGSAANSSNP